MDNGYIIDTPKYNSDTHLYDVTILLNDNIAKVISCYRILNNTKLVYTEEPGYFYISPDSKYLYFKDTTIFTDFFKNIEFSLNNPSKTNKDILDINNDPVQKYTYIILSTVTESSCINLALEDNVTNRLNQIKHAGKYNSYDCLVKNISNNSYSNVESKKDTLYERLSNLFTPSTPSTAIDDKTEVKIVDIHQYNKFYVYGLTTLNMLLIIIIIIMLLMITNDNGGRSKISNRSR